MRRLVDITLIAGFLLVDLFFFHDVFKPGESTSLAQWMTGFLSIGVFASCAQSLLKSAAKETEASTTLPLARH